MKVFGIEDSMIDVAKKWVRENNESES